MTAERYTVVLTGFLSTRKPGEYLYLIMNDDPVQIGGGGALRRGRPPSERLRREIPFQDLPEDAGVWRSRCTGSSGGSSVTGSVIGGI